jgi:nucleoside recognition membrane protein YjiH
MLNKGQWKELVIANNTSFIFESDKPFLPVQYLEGQTAAPAPATPRCTR